MGPRHSRPRNSSLTPALSQNTNGLENFILLTDSYKVTHFLQYPPQTEEVYSYFESRGGKWDNCCFFGLQYIIKRYFVGQVITKEKIDQAESYFSQHLPDFKFNRQGWEYILSKHQGRLPISIKAVKEGTVVDGRNVLLTVKNTDPECFWLTNYVETILVQVWYPMTVCTNSREQKRVIKRHLEKSGDVNLMNFKLHDFGFRGVSSVESAGIGGAAHLVNFLGTDTMAALVVANEFYSEKCAGFSIPASEHSTITSWGRDKELDAMRNMLDSYPTGLVACVSDSYDVYNACGKIWGEELKDKILQRDGALVIRPDSGDPPEVVLKCLEILGTAFGYKENDKGYKVLDPHVRIIQGDGIDIEMIETLYSHIEASKWSADNVGFGSGGALLQKLNRDTLKCAFKCSSITIAGKESDVWKDPITDPGKTSKKGKLSLLKDANGKWKTERGENLQGDYLVEVFRDGKLLLDQTFSEIRERSNQGL
eukprot:c18025_g1_i1.p1 GENE.c18025_g1_i1~~c18025_g1_i1.p1  ORF type:complete len:481 (+),score=184.46 c18025_g1_i1:63-1505(+)